MKDLIVFCPDTTVMVKELREKFPELLSEEDLENPVFVINKTPTKRNGKETLSLVRCRDGDKGEPMTEEMLRGLESVQVLGTWEEVKANAKAKTIYDRVYPRKTVTWTDEEGKKHTHTPPDEIGRFF